MSLPLPEALGVQSGLSGHPRRAGKQVGVDHMAPVEASWSRLCGQELGDSGHCCHVIIILLQPRCSEHTEWPDPAYLAQPACSVWVERGQAGPGSNPSSVTDQLCGLERSLALSEPPFQHL